MNSIPGWVIQLFCLIVVVVVIVWGLQQLGFHF